MHCTFWLCLYFLLVGQATNITTDDPSTTSIPVASSLHFSFPAFATIHFESGFHLCLNWVNYARVRNKSVALADFINSNKSDIIAVTETWLRPDDTDSFIASVTPPGYKCTHVPCPEGRGGGVRFFIHDDIDFKVLPQPCFNTFESISVHLSTGNAQDIIFHTVYRSPQCFQSQFH